MSATWKTVRVFISSTFRDMQSERDWLVRFVFPKLRQELVQRRIHLVDVDLRWGVTSEQDALSVCREVVDECRPRFLCMLGGRYGWVPPDKTRSITADEVHYGVLDRDLKSRGFAYFYFRDPSATAAMVEVTPGEFCEPAGSHGADALAELKTAIAEAGLQPFIYRAQWDEQSRRLIGLKEFGDRVYEDLKQSIDQEFGSTTGEKPDEFTEENAAMEAFIEERVQRFVLGSRESVLKELLAHANSTGGNGYACLTGAAGSGKSALLAKFCQLSTLNLQPSTILITHFVGASPASTDVRRTLRRLCHELVTGAGLTAQIPEDPEKLRVAFAEILQQASAQKRVVILLDAINQFDPTTQLAGWSWLPEELPATARIILSTLSGPALDSLRQLRQPPRLVELQRLGEQDPEAIIREFLHRYRKTLTNDQRAALLAKADAGNPLYLQVALEELRTLGSYEEITERIAQLPPDTRSLFIWILKRLEDDDGFRDASGRKIGRELVSQFVSLLGASRHGLSQRELTELIDPGDPRGNVATLTQLLRPYLMQRGESLDFYHRQFREAVEGAYLASETQRQAAHEQLADYFRQKGDSEDIADRHSDLKRTEIVARAIHEDYLHQQGAAGVRFDQNSSMVPWDALPEHLQESIRQQADDIGAKLQAVHCSMAPLRHEDEPLFEFTPDEIEQLARMEHERWMKAKLQDGWQYGVKRDNARKIHPCLMPFEQLSHPEQDLDRHSVRRIPVILAKAGFRVRRLRQQVDLSQLLLIVVETMAELLMVNAASLYLVDVGGVLRIAAAFGYHKPLEAANVTYQKGEGMTGWILEKGDLVMADSLEVLQAHPGWKGKFNQLQARATSMIRAGDIINLPLLAAKLKEPTDPVSIYLHAQFSNATREVLARYRASDSDPKLLQTALVEDINRVVCAQSIYDLQRFAGVVLRTETERALSQNPQGDSLLRLNRLLLEDAYPLELSRSHNQEPNAFLGIPLKAVDPAGRTGVIGVLKFEDRRTGLEDTPTFTHEDEELGQRVANILATVLACSRFQQRQVVGLGAQLGSPMNLVSENRWQQTVMNDIVETITRVLKVDAASIYLAEENRERLFIQAAGGYQRALMGADPKPSYYWGEGVTGRIADTNKEFCAMSLEELRMLGGAIRGKFDAFQMNMQPCAFYGLPLNVSGEAKPIGVLKVECLQSRQFTRKDVLFMRMMGNIISATAWDRP